jgi:nitrite reductase/ring-hydroxylating ferredoxin subunit
MVVKVAETKEIAPGTAKQIDLNGKKIAVFNLNGMFYALSNTCSHRGGPLSEGEINGDIVTCPWHMANFNIKTGEADGPPRP